MWSEDRRHERRQVSASIGFLIDPGEGLKLEVMYG